MAKENFCCVDNYSVIIPYSEFEKMVNSARKIESMEQAAQRMEMKYIAMQEMFRECLEKIGEINRML